MFNIGHQAEWTMGIGEWFATRWSIYVVYRSGGVEWSVDIGGSVTAALYFVS